MGLPVAHTLSGTQRGRPRGLHTLRGTWVSVSGLHLLSMNPSCPQASVASSARGAAGICLPACGEETKGHKAPAPTPPPPEQAWGPGSLRGGAYSRGAAGQHPALGAMEEDSLRLCFFAVTFNSCRGWRMLYFWSWLFIWGGYCWLWPQGVDLRSKYYRFLSEASRRLCQGPSFLLRILDLARLAVLPCLLSQGRRKPRLGRCCNAPPGHAGSTPPSGLGFPICGV